MAHPPIATMPHATPQTALLAIEVAESPLIQDRLTKAPLYAAALPAIAIAVAEIVPAR